MTRFVLAGTCRTCGQGLVQEVRDGEPVRTYHPAASTTVKCWAMHKIDGETYNDTDHEQFIETPVQPTARHLLTGDTHAFTTGMVAGLLMKVGILVWPEYDERGNYLASMGIAFPGHDPEDQVPFRIAVLPPSKERSR